MEKKQDKELERKLNNMTDFVMEMGSNEFKKAITVLKTFKYEWGEIAPADDDVVEALDVVMPVLEEEKFINKSCISELICEIDKYLQSADVDLSIRTNVFDIANKFME